MLINVRFSSSSKTKKEKIRPIRWKPQEEGNHGVLSMWWKLPDQGSRNWDAPWFIVCNNRTTVSERKITFARSACWRRVVRYTHTLENDDFSGQRSSQRGATIHLQPLRHLCASHVPLPYAAGTDVYVRPKVLGTPSVHRRSNCFQAKNDHFTVPRTLLRSFGKRWPQ